MQKKYKVKAMIHSKKQMDEAYIVKDIDTFHCIAEYEGKQYRTIFNPFSMLYYVDDLYGQVENP